MQRALCPLVVVLLHATSHVRLSVGAKVRHTESTMMQCKAHRYKEAVVDNQDAYAHVQHSFLFSEMGMAQCIAKWFA
jgi:hypothetical protein